MKRLIVNTIIVFGCVVVLPLVIAIGFCRQEEQGTPEWTWFV